MVVLHEGEVESACAGERAGIEALEEVSTLVAEHLWFDEQDFGDGGGGDDHR
ncbi:MAG: hypothetical protein AW07_02747 [Candidatus Accumulibacter sp. SK-11]|nr:MAG: hypothetical protein AW07_02747 [Candidatus Accumulibacter sp. SK-11]